MARTIKFVLLNLVFIFSFLHNSCFLAEPNSVSVQIDQLGENISDDDVNTLTILNQNQIQLQKLQELVKNLTDLVSKLESRFWDCPNFKPNLDSVDRSPNFKIGEKIETDPRKVTDGYSLIEENEEKGLEIKVENGDKGGGGAVSVTKYSPFWSERFQFVSAVKLNSDATCSNVLPFRDDEGFSKYVAVGDDLGRVYVFLRNGEVLVEFETSSESPITAILSYMSLYKNESVVVTGHKNGLILVHRVWEVSSGEELSSISMENVGKFENQEIGEEGSSITILEVHHVGRRKYILSTDFGGRIKVFRENGTIYGEVVPKSRPIVLLKQRLMFLTETGAGSLDLRTMKVRESECEGLNRSIVKHYVFDATERSKAYGVTSEGDLIHVQLLGDIMNFKCRVRSKRKFEMDEPLALQAIKGYLVIVNPEKVFVYNVSSQHYARIGGPRLLFSAGLDEIRSGFLNYQGTDEKRLVLPVIATDREKIVVLGLGNGYVGMYRSNLPLFKGESNTMFWTSPVLFFILFLFGAWQFFSKKKESLTSWGPDDPFSSTTIANGPPLGSESSADRSSSFPDSSSSRNGEVVTDLRTGVTTRGPPRRYISPPRYAGGPAGNFRQTSAETPGASPFRQTSVDTNSRPASVVDPGFRANSEMKFRRSSLEPPPGFPKRKESLFVNSQVVKESN